MTSAPLPAPLPANCPLCNEPITWGDELWIHTDTDRCFLDGTTLHNDEEVRLWNRRAPEAQAWRPAPGWEEHYEVSCYGAVRTKSRRLVTLYHRADGYVVCRLSQPRATVRVHRLVALAFLPKSDKPCVNHIDADTANNVVSNLEWCTQQENIAHASRLGRLSSHQKGKVGPNAMMSREDVTKIRERALTSTHRKIAEEYGVARSTISRIVNGETYGAWTAPHREATNV